MNKEKPKIFISHSWKDNEISRKLAEYLKRDGADIWIDYARIAGGDSLPNRISEALGWCNTLILIWSKSALNSFYVNLEWENALDLKKNIIPCLLDDTERPFILRRYMYIDFKYFEQGYNNIIRALNLSIQKENIVVSSNLIDYKYQNVDQFWIGIDIGASALSIAGGDRISSIDNLKIDNETLIPSIVSIRSDYKLPAGKASITEYSNGIACGKEALLIMRANKERTFFSIKRLIGNDTKRIIKIDYKEILITAFNVLSMLIDYIIKISNNYFSSIYSQDILISNISIAIPNNFSALKIKKIIQTIKELSYIKEICYIYKAEAVTIFYLHQYLKLNEKRTKNISKGVKENILIFDSDSDTISVSIVSLSRPFMKSEKIKIEMQSRFGYSIGEEIIDRSIAETIWEKLGDVKEYLPNPFATAEDRKGFSSDEHSLWWIIVLNLKDIADETKLKLTDKYRLNDIQYQAKYNDEISDKITIKIKRIISYDYLSEERQNIINRILKKEKITLELEDISNNKEIKSLLFHFQECIETAINIYFEKNTEPIHTVIFITKSYFLNIKKDEFAKIIINNNKQEIPFWIESMDEVKSGIAVAYGTTIYALEQKKIALTGTKTLANYGYVITNPSQKNEDTFKNLIPVNTEFDEEIGKVIGIDKNQDVKHNNRIIRFYQVRSEKSKAQEVINNRQKEKYNQIARAEILSDWIKTMKISINKNNELDVEIDDGKGLISFKINIEINDNYDEHGKEQNYND